ncbi:hypothetical protein QJS10_CPB22g00555 [Acorus calamus]|uniref:Uncharacterized protein n=1 Tax=Acorus calamus TaxID=4465 RepID=A0AAV9BYH1_ACOCL|nr:hypothetical protein QJS10_CPB22g00555 [Acorus calamus]
MELAIKEEPLELPPAIRRRSAPPPPSTPVIDLSSSDSDIDGGDGLLGKRSRVPDSDAGGPGKRPKNEEVLLPLGFLDPLLPEEDDLPPAGPDPAVGGTGGAGNQSFRQFWKAGDYEADNVVADMVESTTADFIIGDPNFNIIKIPLTVFGCMDPDGLLEDDGGGMDPDTMRQSSLGYSKKQSHTIGIPTQSVGMLSYTFLRSTGKEDIVVPMGRGGVLE